MARLASIVWGLVRFAVISSENELAVFFIAGAVFHRSRIWLWGLLLAILLQNMFKEIARAWISRANAESVKRRFLSTLEAIGPVLIEVTEAEIQLYVPKIILTLISAHTQFQYLKRPKNRKAAGLTTPHRPLRIFHIAEDRISPLPLSLRAYPSFYNVSYIVLHQHPAKLELMGRFRLFHELAHLDFAGLTQQALRYSKMLSAIATGVTVGMLVGLHWILIVLLIWVVFRCVTAWDLSPTECEIYADLFALRRLDNFNEVKQVVADHDVVWGANDLARWDWRISSDNGEMNAKLRLNLERDRARKRLKAMRKYLRQADTIHRKGYTQGLVRHYDVSHVIGYAIIVYSAAIANFSSIVVIAGIACVIKVMFFGPLGRIYESIYETERSVERTIELYRRSPTANMVDNTTEKFL